MHLQRPTYKRNDPSPFLYSRLFPILFLLCTALSGIRAQYVLRAPTGGDQHNFSWYEASDPTAVIGTDFFLEVTEPGIYYATFDGTDCGSNATDYFLLVRCEAPDNSITLDISAMVSPGATVRWSPALNGDPLRPRVLATENLVQYQAIIEKAGNEFESPGFTVVCLSESAILRDDFVSVFEDGTVDFTLTDNDEDLPEYGSLLHTDPGNGDLLWNDGGTPNDPRDDRFSYTPFPDFNGTDSFTYTICDAGGNCSTADVTLNVIPVVDAISDTVAGTADTELRILFLSNDNDYSDGDTVTFTPPNFGTISYTGSETPSMLDDYFTYMPYPGFTGTVSFTYTICDANGYCSTAEVSIIITAAESTELDTDNDGILDIFEDLDLDGDGYPATNPTDTDGDGVPDYRDIDSDNDGIPDNVEAQEVYAYFAPSGIDLNQNGLDDNYEYGDMLGLTPVDTDGDGFPDYVDEDSDNDGVPDIIEATDWNLDGLADWTRMFSDLDNDGLDDGFEGGEWDDNDPNDEIDEPQTALLDLDSDGSPNFRDTDDDGDGIPAEQEDANRNGDYADDDLNGNGIPDYLDPLLPGGDEQIEVFNVLTPNGDGIHDVLKIRNIDRYPDNSLRIFNRWGRLVFSTRSYGTAGNVFDGTSMEDSTLNRPRKLQTGTYFYLLTYVNEQGVEQTLTGYIYLNR